MICIVRRKKDLVNLAYPGLHFTKKGYINHVFKSEVCYDFKVYILGQLVRIVHSPYVPINRMIAYDNSKIERFIHPRF